MVAAVGGDVYFFVHLMNMFSEARKVSWHGIGLV